MRPVGVWPSACPVPAEAVALVWMDRSIGAAVVAAWLARGGVRWEALVQARASVPAAVGATKVVRFEASGAAASPGGWGPAAEAARTRDRAWLVLPLSREQSRDVPWPAVHEATRAMGVEVWAPFARMTGLEVARLGATLGVDVRAAHGCLTEIPCGACQGCVAHARVAAMLGGDARLGALGPQDITRARN